MITLKDNTKYPPITDNPEKFLLLQNIANRRISELLDENGNNLLVYPHSFELCEDESGKFSYISKVHTVIFCKPMIYIPTCFY